MLYVCNYICTSCSSNKYSFPIGVKSDSTPSKPRHEKGTETPGWPVFLKLQDHEIKSRFLLEIIILPGEVATIPPNVPPDSPVCPKGQTSPVKKTPLTARPCLIFPFTPCEIKRDHPRTYESKWNPILMEEGHLRHIVTTHPAPTPPPTNPPWKIIAQASLLTQKSGALLSPRAPQATRTSLWLCEGAPV